MGDEAEVQECDPKYWNICSQHKESLHQKARVFSLQAIYLNKKKENLNL